MAGPQLEETLRTLHQHAVRVGGRPGRETWRFKHDRKIYFAHFYLRAQTRRYAIGRLAGATQAFAGLQTLQRLKVPAPRGVALLVGFVLKAQRGDLVIVDSLGKARSLEAELTDPATATPRQRAALRDQVIDILRQLGAARLGHRELSLGSFLVAAGRVVLADAGGVRPGGLKTDHLIGFAQRGWPFVSRTDKVRGWRALVPDGDRPPRDLKPSRWFERDERCEVTGWTNGYGRFTFLDRRPARGQNLRQAEWPALHLRVTAKELDVIKSDASGEVRSGTIALNGRPLEVIVKQPLGQRRLRDLLLPLRVNRARRTWEKTAWLLRRDLPVEIPLLYYEPSGPLRRHRDSYVVFARVPGTTLAEFDLDSLASEHRVDLFRALGRILRRIEDTGLAHTDAKSTNWIITPKPGGGVTPVLIDAYGIRRWNIFLALFGLHRLLRAMKQHPQYTPEDSRNLCLGFSPFAPLTVDQGKR